MSKPDPFSIIPSMLLDAGVMRDMADSLDGRWEPSREPDPVERENLLAAARLRLYGERDRCGWYLVTYREARAAGLNRGDANWSVGFVPDVATFDDAPSRDDVEALLRLYLGSGIEPELAVGLAHAVLYEPVEAIVTTQPRLLRHGREFDLPERLQVFTAPEAFAELGIAKGEAPGHVPPPGSPLASVDPWWIP